MRGKSVFSEQYQSRVQELKSEVANPRCFGCESTWVSPREQNRLNPNTPLGKESGTLCFCSQKGGPADWAAYALALSGGVEPSKVLPGWGQRVEAGRAVDLAVAVDPEEAGQAVGVGGLSVDLEEARRWARARCTMEPCVATTPASMSYWPSVLVYWLRCACVRAHHHHPSPSPYLSTPTPTRPVCDPVPHGTISYHTDPPPGLVRWRQQTPPPTHDAPLPHALLGSTDPGTDDPGICTLVPLCTDHTKARAGL